MARFGTPAFIQQSEEFPQDCLPQKDVDPGVQDLVPRGHTDHHQKADRWWIIFISDAQYNNVDLAEGVNNIIVKSSRENIESGRKYQF